MQTKHIQQCKIQSTVYGSNEGNHSNTVYSAKWPRSMEKTMRD